MQRLVTRKVPEIIRIGAGELKPRDLFYLNMKYKTDQSEFTVCDSGREKILVNRALDFADDIVPLIDQIMERKYLDDGVTERLLDAFSDIAGKKSADTLFQIWMKWRDERLKVEEKEEAEKSLAVIRKRRLRMRLKGRKRIINTIFSIGFNLYNEKSSDFEKGSENAFLYGYLCCLEDIENHRIKGFCKECGCS